MPERWNHSVPVVASQLDWFDAEFTTPTLFASPKPLSSTRSSGKFQEDACEVSFDSQAALSVSLVDDLIKFSDSPPRDEVSSRPMPNLLDLFSPSQGETGDTFSAKEWVHRSFDLPFIQQAPDMENDDAVFAFQERLCSLIEVEVVGNEGRPSHVFPTKLNAYLQADNTVQPDEWVSVARGQTDKHSDVDVSDEDLLSIQLGAGSETRPIARTRDPIPSSPPTPSVSPVRAALRPAQTSRQQISPPHAELPRECFNEQQWAFGRRGRENSDNCGLKPPPRPLARALITSYSSDYSD
jgi:hypothetical protein